MKISYDPKVDAIYFRFIEKPCQMTTHRLTEDIAINYDSKGEIAGIEILSAQEHLHFSGKKTKVDIENFQVV